MASVAEIAEIIPPQDRVGQVIDDRYELRGSLTPNIITPTSIIHRAIDREIGMAVVIKELQETNDGLRKSADLEIATNLALAEAPNVLHLHDTRDLRMPETGQRVLVLELAAGGCLRTVANRQKVSIDTAAEIGFDLAIALDAVHSIGLVHCDVKPLNVLRDIQADEWLLADFGIVHIPGQSVSNEVIDYMQEHGAPSLREDATSRPDGAIGTPGYAAPELSVINAEIQAGVDVYGLGATMFYALAGQTPHDSSDWRTYQQAMKGGPAAPIRSLRPDVPPIMEGLITSSLEHNPKNRLTLQELSGELLAL